MKRFTMINVFLLASIVLTIALPVRGGLVFEWSMESESPDLYAPGSDSTPRYSPSNRRTATEARSGSYSLDISGTYHLAAFDNPTNDNVWALTDEGAISLWWKYTGHFTGNRMLVMIDGKCRTNTALDTNEALKLIHRNNSTQLRLTYGWIDGSGYHTTWITYTHPESWIEDQWYNVIVKWDTGQAPSLYLQVDGGTPVTGGAAIGSTTMAAFHQLLWGNDTHNTGEGLFLDDVKVWNDFEMTPEPSAAALFALGGVGLIRRRGR